MSSLRMASRSLRRRRTRTILTVSGIVIGVAMILVLLSISAGASTQTTSLLRNALGAQITVVNATTPSFPGGGGFANFTRGGGFAGGGGSSSGGGFAEFFGTGNTLNESLVSQIDAISGVYAASPQLSTTGYINGGSVLLDGIDPSTYSLASSALDITSGLSLTSSASSDIVLSSTLASNLGVSVGSTVTVGANSTGGASYTVVGIYDAASTFGPATRTAYIPLSAAQAIGGEANKVTEIDVKADTPSLDSTVASSIDSDVSGVRANTATAAGVASTLSGTLSTLFIVVGIVALLAGAFGVVNTMMMSISERTREVGTLRAIGAQKLDIMKIFMSEAFVIGVIGALVGVVVGVAVSLALPSLTGSSAAGAAGRFAGARFISSLNTSVTGSDVILALALGIIVGTLAGVYPAWRASRMNPVEALRHV
ncbi:MAG: FtsX-like permease family protein [Thaumarchaeota archaeon]|nr:FtsX-like permease family protein [Nitrososphaerota archaeon]